MKQKRNKTKNLCFFTAALLFILLIIFSSDVKKAAYDSLKNCAENIVPPLFPALILSSFMTSIGLPKIIKKLFGFPVKRLYGLSENCTEAVLFGSAAGFPSGVKIAVQLYREGKISEKDAVRAALLTVNPGIVYTVTAVGGMIFGSIKTGIMLYISVLSSQTLCAVLTKRKRSENIIIKTSENIDFDFSSALTSSVSRSVTACISMSSWIILFGAFSAIVNNFTLQFNLQQSRLFTEVTDAVSYSLYRNSPEMCAFALGFGGICIFLQLLPELHELGIKPFLYFAYRFMNGGFAWLFMTVLQKLFASEALAVFAEYPVTPIHSSFTCMLSLTFLCIIFMFGIANRFEIC